MRTLFNGLKQVQNFQEQVLDNKVVQLLVLCLDPLADAAHNRNAILDTDFVGGESFNSWKLIKGD